MVATALIWWATGMYDPNLVGRANFGPNLVGYRNVCPNLVGCSEKCPDLTSCLARRPHLVGYVGATALIWWAAAALP